MKSLGLVVFALVTAPAAFAGDRPIAGFFDDFAREWMRGDPVRATLRQYFEGAEQDALDPRLTPVTREFRLARIAVARRGLEALRRYDPQALTPEDRVSYATMEWQLDDIVREEPFLDDAFPFEQFGGVQRRLPDFLANLHPLRNPRDAENYLDPAIKARASAPPPPGQPAGRPGGR